jgi:DNA-binding PadR family transcriptional regulator
MTKGEWLGEFEQVVLLAVARLGEEGYGLTIRREIERRTRRRVTVGAVYATLSRLETKGYVGSWQGEATAKRGGRAKKHYRVLPLGARALEATRRMLDRMWEGVGEPANARRA